MSRSFIAPLRLVGILEGTSFVLLLGVAMPLKYLASIPAAVAIVGAIHGALFVLYLLALAAAWSAMRWPVGRVALLVLAAIVPFGPFISDGWLRRQQHADDP